jgi:SAM-dependent methyltransferase
MRLALTQPTADTEPGPARLERTEALRQAWLDYFRALVASEPAHAGARDFMNEDLRATLARLIPDDASVLEVGCGRGDLLAGLPHRTRAGIDFLPEIVEEARRRHPEIDVRVADATDETDGRTFDAVICDRLGHSVLDIRLLLQRLGERITHDGRIYLVTFNYLWELPTRVAEHLGWKVPSPTANWLSESDFQNLFGLADLEVVRYEDRLILPVDVPGLSLAANRYVAKLPGWQNLSLYRVYVLRKRHADTPRLRTPTVSVVVPSRNEEGNVEAAVRRTPVMGGGTEIIFVEGHSTDATWSKIQQVVADYRGPLKLSAYQQSGKGKGDAVRLGFARATGDILMILDADLTVPPEDLPIFFEAAANKRADFIQGTRLVYPMNPGAMRFANKLGNIGFSKLFTYLLQQPIKDTLCGTKVLWRRDYERIAAARHHFGDFDPFGDFDLIFGAARLNLKLGEIPVRYRERVYGETNIDRWKHGWLLLKMSLVAARKLKYV